MSPSDYFTLLEFSELKVWGMPLWLSILVIVICLFISAIFSASENAFSNCNKYHFKVLAEEGKFLPKLILRLIEKFDNTLITILISNNIVQTLMSFLSAMIFYNICNYYMLGDGVEAFLSTSYILLIGTLLFMLSINVKITLGVVVLTPVSLFVAKFISTKTYSMFKLQSETRGEQTAFIDEIIGNEKVVKAYGYEQEAIKKFDEMNNRLQKYSLRAIFFSSITNPATRFLNGLIYALVAVFGAITVLAGKITVGSLSCFLSYANQYTKPFNEISGVITELQNALACAARIFEVIDEKPEILEADKELNNVLGNITCKDVNFSYDPNKQLITNFNLNVKQGEKVAIVGPTGCGKTTLINLLMRFYDVNSGSIKIDGVDIRDIKRKSLRLSYGMVLQETWLKNATIRENITMGKKDATDEEIIAAAKKSNSHSFIKKLPNGYDTIIGEDGGMLSQGQKQLLCITRVMLCNPEMLILDEATSSIDTRTELKIQDAFNKLMEGRTSFIVAHRLSTIQNADIILVMKDGKIIEQGNHNELLSKKGFYYELFNSQYAV